MIQAKIVIVGESGSGKTSFVQALKGQPVKNPSGTVGCVLEPVLHTYKAGTPEERACFVELWDVGGSQFHKNSRRMFYQNADAIILVHDLTNKKSSAILGSWLIEVLDGLQSPSGFKVSTFDKEQFASQEKPLMVVGTKADLGNSEIVANGRSSFALETGAEEIFINCRQAISAGSNNRLKVDKFFDKVFSLATNDKRPAMASLLLERKRKPL